MTCQIKGGATLIQRFDVTQFSLSENYIYLTIIFNPQKLKKNSVVIKGVLKII